MWLHELFVSWLCVLLVDVMVAHDALAPNITKLTNETFQHCAANSKTRHKTVEWAITKERERVREKVERNKRHQPNTHTHTKKKIKSKSVLEVFQLIRFFYLVQDSFFPSYSFFGRLLLVGFFFHSFFFSFALIRNASHDFGIAIGLLCAIIQYHHYCFGTWFSLLILLYSLVSNACLTKP